MKRFAPPIPLVTPNQLRSAAQKLSLLGAMLGLASIGSAQIADIEFINETDQDIYVHYDLHYGSDCTSTGSYTPGTDCIGANNVAYVAAPPGVFILIVEVSCECPDNVSIVEDIECGEEPVVFECSANQYIMGIAERGWRVEPYLP